MNLHLSCCGVLSGLPAASTMAKGMHQADNKALWVLCGVLHRMRCLHS